MKGDRTKETERGRYEEEDTRREGRVLCCAVREGVECLGAVGVWCGVVCGGVWCFIRIELSMASHS